MGLMGGGGEGDNGGGFTGAAGGPGEGEVAPGVSGEG